MDVAGHAGPFRFAIYPSGIAAWTTTAGRRGNGSADWPKNVGFTTTRGSSSDDDDDPGRAAGPICERVDMVLGRVDPNEHRNGFTHLPQSPSLQGRGGARSIATRRPPSTPEAATVASPCWRCRARHEPTPSRATVHRVLEAVIRQAVLPALRARHRTDPPPLAMAADRLADGLLAPSPGIDATLAAIEPVIRPFGWTAFARAPLIEQAARTLGDRWAGDICDDLAITTALAALQAALDGMAAPGASHPEDAPAVLVLTLPGESHVLGAVLARHCLADSGWRVTTAAPASDTALERLVAGAWLDVLHIAQSCVFRRDHWQARLARTIAGVRAASRNPGLLVSVGGRLFSEDSDAWSTVGADAGSNSAATLHRSIETARRRRRRG